MSQLPAVDRILVLRAGRVAEEGSYRELRARQGEFAQFLQQHLQVRPAPAPALPTSHQEEEEEEGEIQLQEECNCLIKFSNCTTGCGNAEEKNIDAPVPTPPPLQSIPAPGERTALRPSNKGSSYGSVESAGGGGRGGKLTVEEHLETKAVGRQVYSFYFRAVGVKVAAIILLLNLATQV